eukprot:318689-Pyramimonas_sp.AAC.1
MQPLEPNSRWGRETYEVCAEVGAAGACERSHWRRWWSPIWEHETFEGYACMGAAGACERSHSGLRWSSLWGHETCE